MFIKNHPFKYANIYHILVDRFNNQEENLEIKENNDQFLGGTIRGIINKIEYLKELGCTTIFLSPIYQQHDKQIKYMPYHGYHIVNFNEIDQRFGTKDDFKELCETAHQQGISILLDIVPNHISCYHPWVEEAQNGKRKERVKWYNENDPMYFLGFPELWKLNLSDSEVCKTMIDAFVEFYELGTDHFRIDHAVGIPNWFFKQVKSVLTIKAKELQRPRPLLIGEVWFPYGEQKLINTIETPLKGLLWKLKGLGFHGLSQELAQMMYIGTLDGVLDIRGSEMIRNYLIGNGMISKLPIWLFKCLLWLRKFLYPSYFLCGLFVDNHDMDRITYIMNGDVEKVKQSLDLIKNEKGPMIVYYGTELGMNQINTKETIGDIAMRAPMMWSLLKHQKSSLYEYIQKIWKQRIQKREKLF